MLAAFFFIPHLESKFSDKSRQLQEGMGLKVHDEKNRESPKVKREERRQELFEWSKEELKKRYEVEVSEEKKNFDDKMQNLYKVDGYLDNGEVNFEGLLNAQPKMFHDESVPGNPNHAGTMPESCKVYSEKNPEGITYVQPSNIHSQGAVLFGGVAAPQACSGAKRRDGTFNNWPSEAVGGATPMTPDGTKGKNSANFDKGAYGPPSDSALAPIWLGSSGAVQIHSLRSLEGSKTLAGVSSRGCLVVNQDCMKAINAFLAGRSDLKFSIVASSPENDACTTAVNGADLAL